MSNKHPNIRFQIYNISSFSNSGLWIVTPCPVWAKTCKLLRYLAICILLRLHRAVLQHSSVTDNVLNGEVVTGCRVLIRRDGVRATSSRGTRRSLLDWVAWARRTGHGHGEQRDCPVEGRRLRSKHAKGGLCSTVHTSLVEGKQTAFSLTFLL